MPSKDDVTPELSDQAAEVSKAEGTEAKRMGGVEPAKRQAVKDYEESAKESGD